MVKIDNKQLLKKVFIVHVSTNIIPQENSKLFKRTLKYAQKRQSIKRNARLNVNKI